MQCPLCLTALKRGQLDAALLPVQDWDCGRVIALQSGVVAPTSQTVVTVLVLETPWAPS